MPFLEGARTAQASALAVDDGNDPWSYEDLAAAADAVAGRLRELRLGPGEPVGVVGPQSRVYLAALHGIWRSGAPVAPLHGKWTPEERRQALDTLSVRTVLVVESPPVGSGSAGLLSHLDVGEMAPGPGQGRGATRGAGPRPNGSGPSFGGSIPSGARPGPARDGAEAARLLTSGTAGRPRPVSITFGNLRASARGARRRLGLGPEDRWLASLSVAHVGGLALVARAALLGSGLVLTGSVRPEVTLKAMEDGRVTHASLVPTMLHQLLEVWDDRKPVPSTLRALLLGGAPAPVPLLERALEMGFPLAVTYGLTQAASQVATAPPALVREKPGTVGRPLPGVEVRVSDAGELLVRGPTVAPGEAGRDGWLRTGDLARVDEDGDLWILGRVSDRIISGGVNVDPREVELVLEGHPLVGEAAVVGVPDPEWGERVVAAVVLREGDRGLDRSPSSAGSLIRDLERRVRARLSSPKRPRSFQIVEALPLNQNGKLDREKTRAFFR